MALLACCPAYSAHHCVYRIELVVLRTVVLAVLSAHPAHLRHYMCAQFTFLLDDIGIPKDYRHMDGAGVHTFKLVNKAGRDTYVKFHWKTKQGEVNLLEDEAVTVGGGNHSHATQDLQDAIAAGDYPEWMLYIQVRLLADSFYVAIYISPPYHPQAIILAPFVFSCY